MEDIYKKLDNQPLILVLAEFRFSEVKKIEDYIPDIQEELREAYPLSADEEQKTILTDIKSGGFAIQESLSWSFSSADRTRALRVYNNRVVFLCTDYPRFEGFSDFCSEALTVLKKIVNISILLRIGLRYSDLILIEEGESIGDLVDDSLFTSSELADIGSLRHQRNETLLKTEVGKLAIRSMWGHNNIVSFHGPEPLPVKLIQTEENSERLILDFDHIWESAEPGEDEFIVEKAIEILSGLHELSRKAFWKITTDLARNDKWA